MECNRNRNSNVFLCQTIFTKKDASKHIYNFVIALRIAEFIIIYKYINRRPYMKSTAQ